MNKVWPPEGYKQPIIPIASPGYPAVLIAAAVTAVCMLLGFVCLTFVCLAVTLFVCWFFRDPERNASAGTDAVLSPADGRVIVAEKLDQAEYYEGPCQKVSIFMNVFNVHVNRIPFSGTVKTVTYYPGKFFSANLDKAAKENERNAVLIETETGKNICTVQIAGLIARRIVCGIKDGDKVTRGDRFGMIRFGSRLDVYLPSDAKIDVSIGDKVQAGTSAIGTLN